MNVYEIHVEIYKVRVKASNFQTAIRRVLEHVSGEINLNSRNRSYVTLSAKVIARDVPADYEIPDFDEVP